MKDSPSLIRLSSARKTVIVLLTSLSLITLPGPITGLLHLPTIPSASALAAPCSTHSSTGVCSEFWYPAGAAMDTEQIKVFNGASAEGSCRLPEVCFGGLPEDLTDSPISQTGIVNSSAVYISAPIKGLGTDGQFAYLSSWQRVVNDEQAGIPNYFTWLDVYSPNPPSAPGTVRQAFAQGTGSLNPYIGNTVQDGYVLGNIYDSLNTVNPLGHTQIMDWMVITSSPSPLPNSQLTYTPPAGTTGTFRFDLRQDIYFQDGRKVTAFDVAFSYLSFKANGSPPASGILSMTGITVLGSTIFDISVNATTAFTKNNLGSIPILPARYWIQPGPANWDNAVAFCSNMGSRCCPAQFTLGPKPPSGPPPVQCSLACMFPAADLNADPAKTTPTFDPLASGVLIGSGPWECASNMGTLGIGCSSTGKQGTAPGDSITLTRFGRGLVPGNSITADYFRSSGDLALWVWSGDRGSFGQDFLNFAMAARCFGQPLDPAGPCSSLQQGIGANGGSTIVGLTQIGIVERFVGVAWVSPFHWESNPPTGIAPFPPVLFAGSDTLNPASLVGCTKPYPAGGYDC